MANRPEWPFATNANALILRPLSAHCGADRWIALADGDANDPKPSISRRLGRGIRPTWQDNLKRRSVRVSSRGSQSSAVSFDNGAANRRAHPHAMGLRCKECIEDAVDIFWLYPRTGILNRDFHTVRFKGFGFDLQLAWSIHDPAHGIDGVVADYLPIRPAMMAGSAWPRASRGSVMQMVVPLPGAETSVMAPPRCCVTRLWTM
jgi:hypothetical protein